MVSLETVEQAIGKELATITYTFDERDTALYAIGVGAPHDWLDKDELKFVYERHPDFCALPTMPVIYSSESIHDIVQGNIAGIQFNPMMLVHGEQSLTIHDTLPIAGTIHCVPRIRSIYDKGSGMLITTEVDCQDSGGETIAVTSSSMFIRGLGGYGGERGSSEKITLPEREPDAVHQETTLNRQAIIYRLSGDINPLHIDPDMAAVGNFDTPILHGLATYGFAARAVLKHFAGNDPSQVTGMTARFSREVYPGETLVTQMWQTGEGILFQTLAQERGEVVLSNARITLR